jgi:hypothetical protein
MRRLGAVLHPDVRVACVESITNPALKKLEQRIFKEQPEVIHLAGRS